MRITQEGPRLVVTRGPSIGFKLVAVFFVGSALFYALVAVLVLTKGPRKGSIDCARARGACELRLSAWEKTVPIGDVESAQVVPSRRLLHATAAPRVLEIRLESGQALELSEEVRDDAVAAGLRRAGQGMSQFLADPSRPSFATTYVASDDGGVAFLLYGLLLPLCAAACLRLWRVRRVEVDPDARMIRVEEKSKLGGADRRQIPFSDCQRILASGRSETATIAVETKDRVVPIVGVDRFAQGQAHAKQVLAALTGALGVPLEANEGYRATWSVP